MSNLQVYIYKPINHVIVAFLLTDDQPKSVTLIETYTDSTSFKMEANNDITTDTTILTDWTLQSTNIHEMTDVTSLPTQTMLSTDHRGRTRDITISTVSNTLATQKFTMDDTTNTVLELHFGETRSGLNLDDYTTDVALQSTFETTEKSNLNSNFEQYASSTISNKQTDDSNMDTTVYNIEKDIHTLSSIPILVNNSENTDILEETTKFISIHDDSNKMKKIVSDFDKIEDPNTHRKKLITSSYTTTMQPVTVKSVKKNTEKTTYVFDDIEKHKITTEATVLYTGGENKEFLAFQIDEPIHSSSTIQVESTVKPYTKQVQKPSPSIVENKNAKMPENQRKLNNNYTEIGIHLLQNTSDFTSKASTHLTSQKKNYTTDTAITPGVRDKAFAEIHENSATSSGNTDYISTTGFGNIPNNETDIHDSIITTTENQFIKTISTSEQPELKSYLEEISKIKNNEVTISDALTDKIFLAKTTLGASEGIKESNAYSSHILSSEHDITTSLINEENLEDGKVIVSKFVTKDYYSEVLNNNSTYIPDTVPSFSTVSEDTSLQNVYTEVDSMPKMEHTTPFNKILQTNYTSDSISKMKDSSLEHINKSFTSIPKNKLNLSTLISLLTESFTQVTYGTSEITDTIYYDNETESHRIGTEPVSLDMTSEYSTFIGSPMKTQKYSSEDLDISTTYASDTKQNSSTESSLLENTSIYNTYSIDEPTNTDYTKEFVLSHKTAPPFDKSLEDNHTRNFTLEKGDYSTNDIGKISSYTPQLKPTSPTSSSLSYDVFTQARYTPSKVTDTSLYKNEMKSDSKTTESLLFDTTLEYSNVINSRIKTQDYYEADLGISSTYTSDTEQALSTVTSLVQEMSLKNLYSTDETSVIDNTKKNDSIQKMKIHIDETSENISIRDGTSTAQDFSKKNMNYLHNLDTFTQAMYTTSETTDTVFYTNEINTDGKFSESVSYDKILEYSNVMDSSTTTQDYYVEHLGTNSSNNPNTEMNLSTVTTITKDKSLNNMYSTKEATKEDGSEDKTVIPFENTLQNFISRDETLNIQDYPIKSIDKTTPYNSEFKQSVSTSPPLSLDTFTEAMYTMSEVTDTIFSTNEVNSDGKITESVSLDTTLEYSNFMDSTMKTDYPVEDVGLSSTNVPDTEKNLSTITQDTSFQNVYNTDEIIDTANIEELSSMHKTSISPDKTLENNDTRGWPLETQNYPVNNTANISPYNPELKQTLFTTLSLPFDTVTQAMYTTGGVNNSIFNTDNNKFNLKTAGSVPFDETISIPIALDRKDQKLTTPNQQTPKSNNFVDLSAHSLRRTTHQSNDIDHIQEVIITQNSAASLTTETTNSERFTLPTTQSYPTSTVPTSRSTVTDFEALELFISSTEVNEKSNTIYLEKTKTFISSSGDEIDKGAHNIHIIKVPLREENNKQQSVSQTQESTSVKEVAVNTEHSHYAFISPVNKEHELVTEIYNMIDETSTINQKNIKHGVFSVTNDYIIQSVTELPFQFERESTKNIYDDSYYTAITISAPQDGKKPNKSISNSTENLLSTKDEIITASRRPNLRTSTELTPTKSPDNTLGTESSTNKLTEYSLKNFDLHTKSNLYNLENTINPNILHTQTSYEVVKSTTEFPESAYKQKSFTLNTHTSVIQFLSSKAKIEVTTDKVHNPVPIVSLIKHTIKEPYTEIIPIPDNSSDLLIPDPLVENTSDKLYYETAFPQDEVTDISETTHSTDDDETMTVESTTSEFQFSTFDTTTEINKLLGEKSKSSFVVNPFITNEDNQFLTSKSQNNIPLNTKVMSTDYFDSTEITIIKEGHSKLMSDVTVTNSITTLSHQSSLNLSSNTPPTLETDAPDLMLYEKLPNQMNVQKTQQETYSNEFEVAPELVGKNEYTVDSSTQEVIPDASTNYSQYNDTDEMHFGVDAVTTSFLFENTDIEITSKPLLSSISISTSTESLSSRRKDVDIPAWTDSTTVSDLTLTDINRSTINLQLNFKCLINTHCPLNKACLDKACQDPCEMLGITCNDNKHCKVINHEAVCVCDDFAGNNCVRGMLLRYFAYQVFVFF